MKLAILGTGMIVNEGALPALKQVPEIEVSAIFARPKSREKADRLAIAYKIPTVYTDYDELLANPDIDFIYVGLVNSVHYEYTKKALSAKKNVILEKPFASTAAQVEELRSMALDNGLYIFEAVTTLHLPNFYALKGELLKLGTIRAVTANFSQYSSRYDRYLARDVAPAFDPACEGGALMDSNIYNLNFIVGLFGAPEEVNYMANIGFNGIDTSGVVLMKYKDFMATAFAAKDSAAPSVIIIQGEKGWIRVPGKPNEFKAFEVWTRGSDTTKLFELNRYEHRMVHEFKEFAETFNNKDYDRMKRDLDVSLTVLETAEKARKSAGIKFPCDDD